MSIYVKTNLGASNVSESMIQFVENKPYSQIYDIGHKLIRVASGSKFVSATGNDYVLLFTQDQLSKMFGTAQVDTARLGITTCNGDGESITMNFYNIMVWKGDLYQYFTGKPSGLITINYRLVYVYPAE
jgi:hypothetical protein|nr:MAG TPA: hypothetical protein [Bacteriophage sp.]